MGNLTDGGVTELLEVSNLAKGAGNGEKNPSWGELCREHCISWQHLAAVPTPALCLLLKLAQRARGAKLQQAAGKQVPTHWQKNKMPITGQGRKLQDRRDQLITLPLSLLADGCFDWGIEALQRAGGEGFGHIQQQEKRKQVGKFWAVGG